MQDISPQNAVHLIGQVTPLYFNCSFVFASDVRLFHWHAHVIRYTARTQIAYGGAITFGDVTVNVLGGRENIYDIEGYNLIVKNANFGDAGAYRCQNQEDRINRWAEAIILGKFVFTCLVMISLHLA